MVVDAASGAVHSVDEVAYDAIERLDEAVCSTEGGAGAVFADIIMPNLSPTNVRGKYLLYDGKICTGEEAAECNQCLRRRVESVGYKVEDARGDHPDFIK